MKKLKGKALLHFEYWLKIEMIILPDGGIEALGELFQNALIIEWLDSVRISIDTHPNILETPIVYSFHVRNFCHKEPQRIRHHRGHSFENRLEATNNAILKAVEILNDRL